MRSAKQSLLIAVVAVCAACVGVFAQGAPGQQPATPTPNAPLVRTASISGQVVDGDTGEPIGGAVVRLQSRQLAAAAAASGRGAGRAGQPLSAAEMAATSGTDFVLADPDGRFVFHDLPKGPSLLTATLGGHVERPGTVSRPYQLVDGQHLSDVKLRLVKTASVSGTIVDEAGEPLVGVSVKALRREMPAGVAKLTLIGNAHTDDRGMYRLDGLVPGQFFIVLPQTQTTIPVANAERSADLTGGMLGANNPLIEALTGGMQTMLGTAGVRVGDQMWQSSNGGNFGNVAAPPPPVNGRVAAYQTSFYPGATQLSQATPIALRSGEARTAVDWQVRPSGVARVTGAASGPEGAAQNLVIRLVPAPGTVEDDALPVAVATTSADGSFVFMGVPTGQYVAKAQQQPRAPGLGGMAADLMASLPPEAMAMLQGRVGGSGDSQFLRASISVSDKDTTGLSLALRPGAKVSGRIVFDGAAAPPTTQQLVAAQVTLVPTGGGNQQGQSPKVVSDGTFKTTTYAPGTYTINITGLQGAWMMKSAMIGGRDASVYGFDLGESDIVDAVITYTDRIPAITGTVKSDGTAPLPNATVIMIPADYRAWLSSGAAASGQTTSIVQPNGNYAFGRLRPGDYLLAAVPDEALVTDHDVAFYDALSRIATRVTVGDGEKKQLELRLLRSVR